MTIEQVVAKRRKLLVDMTASMDYEVRKMAPYGSAGVCGRLLRETVARLTLDEKIRPGECTSADLDPLCSISIASNATAATAAAARCRCCPCRGRPMPPSRLTPWLLCAGFNKDENFKTAVTEVMLAKANVLALDTRCDLMSATELKEMGHSAEELHAASYAVGLKAAGYTFDEARRAGYTSDMDLLRAGYEPCLEGGEHVW